MLYPILTGVAVFVVAAYLVNPFSRYSVIRRPYRAQMTDTALEAIDENSRLRVQQNPLSRAFAYLLCGAYILNTRYIKSPKSQGETVEQIIADIHRLRFDPNKLLLTSGDHFSSLFVRNLGVFYYPTLDTLIPSTEKQWQNRQICYLQTLAYALGVFDRTDQITTTITPIGRYTASCINFYAYPSDTMYGMLYALASLLGIESGRADDYSSTPSLQQLDTIPAATQLLDTYGPRLSQHYQTYRETVFDESTGLIRKSIHMSGAKDITRRTSAFFDNVVFWKTTELAMKLELIEHDAKFLRELKSRILKTFWLPDEGYFLEDLSDEGVANKYYSSDWLIVLATKFLSPAVARERHYFARSIDYIQAHNIDQPFAIKYQQDTRAHRQFFVVKLAVASYGGDSIWSFWGMEYIKSLLLLYRATDDASYLDAADYHIDMYCNKMREYGGYPEVYDANGKLLQTPFYRSIRQTGWVIGFEQVLAMRREIS